MSPQTLQTSPAIRVTATGFRYRSVAATLYGDSDDTPSATTKPEVPAITTPAPPAAPMDPYLRVAPSGFKYRSVVAAEFADDDKKDDKNEPAEEIVIVKPAEFKEVKMEERKRIQLGPGEEFCLGLPATTKRVEKRKMGERKSRFSMY